MGQHTDSQTPLCPRCRQPARGGDRFCRHCGYDLKGSIAKPGSPSQATTASPVKKRIPRWPFVAAGVGVGVVAALVFGAHSQRMATTSALKPSSRSGKNLPTTQKTASSSPSHSVSPSPSPSSSPSASPSPSPSSSPGSNPSPSTGPSLSGNFVNVSTSFRGATLGLSLPQPLDHLESSSPGSWQWGSKKGQVSLFVTAQRPADITQPLGPQTFGTAITQQGKVVSQSIYIHWTGHWWVGVAIQVPAKHESWLSRIAQSVHVS
ncbi:MAG: zinc ribbon domain-containing protein [Firmicutes bacterium]|nr:zinc ribbon domain-containing protein [Bacillota bacterium]